MRLVFGSALGGRQRRAAINSSVNTSLARRILPRHGQFGPSSSRIRADVVIGAKDVAAEPLAAVLRTCSSSFATWPA